MDQGKYQIYQQSKRNYTTRHEYPICNHTENIGYTKGITSDGVPFEAELFEKDDVLTLSVVMPAIYNDNTYFDDKEKKDNQSNIIGIQYEVESMDYSILDIGMVDVAEEENKDVIEQYVDYLCNCDIVAFASNVFNGIVMYRIDHSGNELAKVMITLKEGDDYWAYTSLDFQEFDNHKRDSKPVFTVIRNK
ncbi:MAG: hypothetical protein Q4E53_07025 [Eubacteriales bacterium]|nr:hypothetical protein [Eubacteriales bacterium]